MLPSDPVPDDPPRGGREDFVLAGIEYLLGQRFPAARGGGRETNPDSVGGDLLRPAPELLGIRLVAELAGKSHAAPLFHFPDRTCLVAAVAAEGFRRLVVRFRERAGRGPVGVDSLVLRYAQWAGEAPALFATMYDPALAGDLELLMLAGAEEVALERLAGRHGGAPSAVRRRYRAFRELLDAKFAALAAFMAAVEAGQRDGRLRTDVGAAELAHAVASLADGLAWQRVTERQGSARLLDAHARSAIGLLLQGIEREAGSPYA